VKKVLLMFCLIAGLIKVCHAQTKETGKVDPKEKAKILQKLLRLNQDQTTKVIGIYTAAANQFEKIKDRDKGNLNKIVIDVRPLRNETVARVRSVLEKGQIADYEKWTRQTSDTFGGWAANQAISDR